MLSRGRLEIYGGFVLNSDKEKENSPRTLIAIRINIVLNIFRFSSNFPKCFWYAFSQEFTVDILRKSFWSYFGWWIFWAMTFVLRLLKRNRRSLYHQKYFIFIERRYFVHRVCLLQLPKIYNEMKTRSLLSNVSNRKTFENKYLKKRVETNDRNQNMIQRYHENMFQL